MLQSWNNSIFSNVRDRLLSAAMKFLYAERSGEAFDSQLVVGVRESFGELTHTALPPFYNHRIYLLSISLSHTHSLSHTPFQSLSHTLTLSHVHTLSLTYTDSLTHSLSLTHTYSLTYTPFYLSHTVNLSTEVANKLRIYQEHFEKAYIQSAIDFYTVHAPAYLTENGVQNYMRYVRGYNYSDPNALI